MKITDAKVFVGGPAKNYVTLKVMTDQGVFGLGDATLNNRETLPAKYLEDYLVPNLIGMDPRNSEDLWQFFYRGAYFRRGPIAMAAIGAIDMALWDIKAKLSNLPLYQLFGGKSRDAAMVYAHATGADLDDLFDSIAHYVEQGYKAVRVQCGIPGMPTASYAVPEKKGNVKNYISDFSGIRPKVEIWDSNRYLRFMPDALAQIRERFGPELHILHDVHHRLSPREAAQFTGFHGAPSHSPISMAAQAHLNVWAPNFGIQEYLVLGTPECDALFPSEHTMQKGMFYVSDAPGLGVDFDEKEAGRYRYQPGSHPIVRLEDGTLWDY